jgi:CBS domain-containing protein
MPFTVRQLIGSNKELVTVLNTDPVKTAQRLMVENQFSQLPVVDEHNKALGLITSDSILRALHTFGVSIESLRVLDAMDEVERTFRDDDDLFALLNNLMETYAVLIVDSEHRLTGIVTSYDTTEYFRRRAEDMMYSEDIETMLKDFINAYFSEETGEIDEVARDEAITEIMPSTQDLLKPFQKALAYYLELEHENSSKPRSDWAELAFSKYLYTKEPSKAFDKLTLNHYIVQFLKSSKVKALRWS